MISHHIKLVEIKTQVYGILEKELRLYFFNLWCRINNVNFESTSLCVEAEINVVFNSIPIQFQFCTTYTVWHYFKHVCEHYFSECTEHTPVKPLFGHSTVVLCHREF